VRAPDVMMLRRVTLRVLEACEADLDDLCEMQARDWVTVSTVLIELRRVEFVERTTVFSI
jgi:hypothetical protein